MNTVFLLGAAVVGVAGGVYIFDPIIKEGVRKAVEEQKRAEEKKKQEAHQKDKFSPK